MKKLLLFFSFTFFLYSQENEFISKLEIDFIKAQEKGLYRDFLINEYLKDKIDSNTTYELLPLISNMNDELFYNFAKNFDDETNAVAQCMKMDINSLIDSYSDCIVNGLSIKEASSLSSVQLQLLIEKLSSKYSKETKKIKILLSSIPFTRLILEPKDSFYDVFLGVTPEFREEYFNYKLPTRTLNKIIVDKENFEKYVKISVSNRKLENINRWLLNLDFNEITDETLFLLSLNAIYYNDFNKAYLNLTNAISKSSNDLFKNKINFWLYLVTKDENYLEKILTNPNIDFYNLIAKAIKNLPIDDFSFLTKLDMKNDNIDRKSLIHSIIKNKSNFITNSVSSSFEIGLTQLKSETLEKYVQNSNELLDFYKSMDSNRSIHFANLYIDDLENRLGANILKQYLEYVNSNSSSDFIEKYKFEGITDYRSFLIFELFQNHQEIKEFLSTYYLYKRAFLENNKEFKFSSILENLSLSHHK